MRKSLLVLSMSLLLQSSLAFGTQVTCSNEVGMCKVEETEGMCSCEDGMSTGWETAWIDDEEPQIPEMSEEELMEMCESELAMACPSPSDQCEPDELQLCTAILTKMEQFESQCEPPILNEGCKVDGEDKDDILETDSDWDEKDDWQNKTDSDTDPLEDQEVDDVVGMEKPQSVNHVDEEVYPDPAKEDSSFDIEGELPVHTGPDSWEIVRCCDELDDDETYREMLECVDALEEGDCTGYEACVPDWANYYCGEDVEGGEDYDDTQDKDGENGVDGGADMDVDQDIDEDDDDDWVPPRGDHPHRGGGPIIDDLPFLGCQAAPQAPSTKASLLTLVLTLADL